MKWDCKAAKILPLVDHRLLIPSLSVNLSFLFFPLPLSFCFLFSFVSLPSQIRVCRHPKTLFFICSVFTLWSFFYFLLSLCCLPCIASFTVCLLSSLADLSEGCFSTDEQGPLFCSSDSSASDSIRTYQVPPLPPPLLHPTVQIQ